MSDIELTPLQQRAADLAEIAWRNVDFDRWDRRKVWDQFTDRVRLAATTTSSLSRFWSDLCQRMSVSEPSYADTRRQLAAILRGGADRDMLRLLRTETELIILIVRLRSEERSEARKEREAELIAEIEPEPEAQEALL